MPAQQLRDRLGAVFDESVWLRVLAAQAAWLHHGYGDPLPDIHTLVVHETSGLSGRADATSIFEHHFQTTAPTAANPHPPAKDGITAQFDVTGDGTVMEGMEPPRMAHHARPLNASSIGAETGHAWGNYGGNDHQGPYISDAAGHTAATPNKHGWLPLSGNDVNNGPDDVPGIKLWAMVDRGEVIVGSWTTASYAGPWREAQRVPEMLFSEAQYRGWALLARWICEGYLVPRNFAILPHKTRVTGYGLHGSAQGMLHDAASFSAIVLADEALSRSPATFGLPAGAVPTDAALQAQYSAAGAVVVRGPLDPHGDAHANDVNTRWEQLCGAFRGITGHGFSGDPTGDLVADPHVHPPPPPPNVRVLRDHDCPGPMFDWHRFAREVWDWWWHPFDLDEAKPATAAVSRRRYSQANHDATTPLNEYYWGTPVATILARKTTGIHGAHSSPSTFALPDGARIYALANGEVVAARFPTTDTGVDFSLLVVRHEVFHQLDPRPAAAAPPGGLPQFANRIDYDTPPSSVYSIYVHLGRPAGLDFTAVNADNPDWLNRMLVRMKECELGVRFRASDAGQAIPDATWDNFPPGTVRGVIRNSIDRAWASDADAYGPTLRRLGNGELTLMPADRMVTPVRVILGDYLGDAGVIKRDAAGAHSGIRVEIVSSGVISTDFTETVTDAVRLWDPVAGPAGTRHAVRYPSEWSQAPTGDVLAAMTAAGVTDTSLATWWDDVAVVTGMHGAWPDGSSLPTGSVVHYDPYEFLPWINARTWTSEWPKYRVDPAAVPAHPIPRS